MAEITDIHKRKHDHIAVCRDQDVEGRYTGFDKISLLPCAVPELNLADVDVTTSFLGRTFAAPVLITGMTGGIKEGHAINRRLARAAQAFNIPMGIGSQRMALEDPQYRSIFTLKDETPNLFLIGNIGMAELLHSNAVALCQAAVDMIDGDALAIHLNVLQECVQDEGSREFKGFLKSLSAITKSLSVPVIVKEVGCGIALEVGRQLLDAGVTAIDCGGRGGTSWPYVEGLRSEAARTQQMGDLFRDWGIPTAYNIAVLREAFPEAPLVATGGIRDGLTIAKALGLGASMVGIGLPLLRAALAGDDMPHALLTTYIHQLRVSMLASGVAHVKNLRQRVVWGDPYAAQCQRILQQKTIDF
jgi:isopentenyl-diphosphate delta-isomerase